MRRRIGELEEREGGLAARLEAEKQLRAEAEQQARNLERRREAATASFVLLPGLLRRGDEEPDKLVVPKGVTKVELKLDLEGDVSYSSFRAELRTAGGNLLRSEIVPSAAVTPGGTVVRLMIPAGILSNGEYEITLMGRRENGPLETVRYYYFLVLRR
jgi:hypothetical protein